MNLDQNHEIKIGVVLVVIFLVVFSYVGFDKIAIMLQPIPEVEDWFIDNYNKFGVAVIFFYELIPGGFAFVSNAGFYGNLINGGVPAYVLILVQAVGKLGGDLLMYSVGRMNLKWWKNSNFAGASHIMHRHKIIIFFIVPFGGMLGTFIMVLAGHQKINIFKIIPILLVANVISMATFVYPFLFQFGLGT